MEARDRAGACAIAVVYEDVPARDLASQLCGRLARRFEGDLGFELTWWRFKYLRDPEIARQAAQAAAEADLILLSLREPENLPGEVKTWFEQWIARRQAAEGALAVVRPSDERRNRIRPPDAYLRLVAGRANLDYLPFSVAEAGPPFADRPREDQVFPNATGWYAIPDQPYHSSGWGINE